MVPPNHPFVHRVFHYFHHPFWGVNTPIFEKTPISLRRFEHVDSSEFVDGLIRDDSESQSVGPPSELGSIKECRETHGHFAPENRPFNAPKGKPDRIPTIHFQVLLLLVSGRVSQN